MMCKIIQTKIGIYKSVNNCRQRCHRFSNTFNIEFIPECTFVHEIYL